MNCCNDREYLLLHGCGSPTLFHRFQDLSSHFVIFLIGLTTRLSHLHTSRLVCLPRLLDDIDIRISAFSLCIFMAA